jgi:hypothetical protein
MKILNIYQNFYLRNIVSLAFIILIVFSTVYADLDGLGKKTDVNPSLLLEKIAVGILPIYILVLVSNILIIRNLLDTKRYKIYVPLFLIYWIIGHIFLTWYVVNVVGGQYPLLSSISTVSNGTGLYFLHLWILRNITRKSKDLMNAEAELSFLKQQLNPHFLLNAMNNLYGESLSNPESVPERILNLSDMLRYQIEATKKEMVPLNQEVEFLRKYLQYYTFKDERLVVSQKYLGDFNNIEIPPLLLLPLVENAVKFSATADHPFIEIELNVTHRNLVFFQKNNFSTSNSTLKGTGIGIKNLKRRLEVYGLEHQLTYKEKHDLFITNMKIWELPIVAS